jgi:SAM-dependent methyltransferase
MAWWESFFDDDYLRIWEGSEPPGNTERQADDLWRLLELAPGSKVLDAPCGYGRISRALAEKGAIVLGLDLSSTLLEEAERRRGEITQEQLRYRRHDLRTSIPESGFDVALNIFTSLGYGSEEDDVAVLRNLRDAVIPGGSVFIETNHRDQVIARFARGANWAKMLPDGTIMFEDPVFDPIAGRMNSKWHWSGPSGAGIKAASVRTYAVTELIKLVEGAGLRVRSAHNSCSPDPYQITATGLFGRVGLLAVRD